MKDIYLIWNLLSLRGIGPNKVNTILKSLRAKSNNLSKENNLLEELKKYLTENQFKEFIEGKDKIKEQLKIIEKDNWSIVSVLSKDYPQKIIRYLGKNAPPLLFYKGNTALLKNKNVGFCGSRKASQIGLLVARDCVKQLSHQKIGTISGYAAGIDQEVHKSALAYGGTTIIVLPEGILNFKIKKYLKDIWDWNRVLVISQFLPDAKWSVSNAMSRNKIIVSLSDLMILIEAKSKGGSMDAGRTALKMGKPLYTPIYRGMPDFATGNKILLKEGAIPLNRDEKSKFTANLLPLYNKLNTISLY